MLFLDDLDHICSLLRDGRNILIPTDGGWCFCHDAQQFKKLNAAGRPTQSEPDDRMIIVSSPDMFQDVVPSLHPRIQTLLSFHQHALALEFDSSQIQLVDTADFDHIFVKMAVDEYSKGLIEHYGRPLWCHRIYEGNEVVLNYEDIPTTALQQADFVSQHHAVPMAFSLPVLARYNKKAVLDFIRE